MTDAYQILEVMLMGAQIGAAVVVAVIAPLVASRDPSIAFIVM